MASAPKLVLWNMTIASILSELQDLKMTEQVVREPRNTLGAALKDEV